MIYKNKIFRFIMGFIMILFVLACILPFVLLISSSFTSEVALAQNGYSFIPSEFSLSAYKYIWSVKGDVLRAYGISFLVTGVGTAVSVVMTMLFAYPLSRKDLPGRRVLSFIIFFTMLFNGGFVPTYLIYSRIFHITDTIWALILPTILSVYNIVLMINFFRGIPKELEEAAIIDGANHFITCFRVYVPCAKPSIATLTLFSFITQWNSYFDGLIFSNFPSSYPLASYLYTVVVKRDLSLLSIDEIKILSVVDDRTIRCAQIFISLIPIMLIYPFAQKYFVKGMTVGSVKG